MKGLLVCLLIGIVLLSGCSSNASFYSSLGRNIIIPDQNDAVENLDLCYNVVSKKGFTRFTIDKVTCDNGRCLCE